ncbi:hypothetical protein CVS40_10499 [Lucilia cuprina]|nr:hypothetical protein CVS40_10499 [Lucilia cuprina]
MYLTGSVDEQLMLLNNGLQLLHSAVPLKRRMIRGCGNGWINAPEIRYQLSLRDLAYGAYLDNRTDANWRKSCRCKNKAKMII